ncbi:putative amino acid transporter [Trypanosoma conorhini]|uniref:Putative amino acid transporter n=1 Tax=Trypanosoma conorhini TaxID=83891 RepID=A0A422MX79_9TRYP|nr:putative amino acid transporter [Trypanosoma conorhini]RNE97813.1 putative amino acid transporter [Trypanosoma conorhini]
MSQLPEPNDFGEDTAEKTHNERSGEPHFPDADGRGETRPDKYLPCSDVDEAAEDNDVSSEGDRFGVLENSNIFKCAFNVFKGNVASAVFLLPTFYKDSGYILSPIIGLIIGSIVVDCSRLLVRAKTKVNRRSVSDYLRLCDFVLGKPFRYVLLVALLLTQFGFCLLYLQLFGGSMAKLVPRFSGDEYVWMTVMFALILPVSFFSENLAFLAIISIIATFCVFFALISTAVLAFIKLHESGVSPSTIPWGRSIPLGWFNNMANNMMVLEGIGVVLPVENSCKDKPRFRLVLTVVLYLVVGWYLMYGLAGYLAYGEALEVSLVDALDVNAFSIVVRVAFTINIWCTYPILFMPAILQIDSLLGWRPRSLKGILMRIVINAAIYGVAMAVGTGAVGIVVSLIGALPAAVMLMLLPALLSLFVESSVEDPDEPRMSREYWRRSLFGKRCTLIRARAYFYFCLGILIMVVGTLSVVKGLVG